MTDPKFPNTFTPEPHANPVGNVWPVFGWLVGAGLAFGAAILAFRRLEKGHHR